MIEIHGAPFDLGGARRGSRMGPGALRLGGLIEAIRPYREVTDCGDIQIDLSLFTPEAKQSGIPYFSALKGVLTELRARTQLTVDAGRVPLMLGGEHTLSSAPLSVLAEKYGKDLAVIWIDAHADLNNPKSSPSGNPHGMPIGSLIGLESGVDDLVDSQWKEWVKLVSGGILSLDQFHWIGLRDVDHGERDRLRELPTGHAYSMHDIDRKSLINVWSELDAKLTKDCKALYISFDVDVLDPVLAPGVGTAVRGGLTYREAHLLAELMCESLARQNYELVGLDVVEVSPIDDQKNETAKMAIEWIASLFGRTILGA